MQRILIAGFGFMGEIHVQAYRGIPAAEIIGVVDSREPFAREKAARIGLDVPIFADLSEAIKATNPDIVDVCLPTDKHTEAAIRALDAGKHLFCEKPVAISLDAAEQIRSAARRSGKFCQVGQCIRFWPEYQAFERFVRSGRGGKLLSLTLQRRAGRPGYSSDNWLNDPVRSLGAAVDLHIHDTDYVLHLLGTPRAVFSRGTRDQSGWSHIFTQFLYDNDAPVVAAEGGWNYPPQWGFQMAFQAVFEEGTVEFDSGASQTLLVTLGSNPREPLPFASTNTEASGVAGNISALGGYANELEYFISCVERSKPPEIATLDQAIESLRVVLCELESAQSGTEITLNK